MSTLDYRQTCTESSCGLPARFAVVVIENRELVESCAYCEFHFSEFQKSSSTPNPRITLGLDEIEFDVDLMVVDQARADGYLRMSAKDVRYKLLIMTGFCELTGLYNSIVQPVANRPLTFHSWATTIETLGATMQAALIDDWVDNIYYSKLRLQCRREVRHLDCRPSDAINLAIVCNAPVLFNAVVLSKIEVS